MPEEEILDLLEFMIDSIRLIENRFQGIQSADEFVQSMNGME